MISIAEMLSEGYYLGLLGYAQRCGVSRFNVVVPGRDELGGPEAASVLLVNPDADEGGAVLLFDPSGSPHRVVSHGEEQL